VRVCVTVKFEQKISYLEVGVGWGVELKLLDSGLHKIKIHRA
jgi:hypothetical protein